MTSKAYPKIISRYLTLLALLVGAVSFTYGNQTQKLPKTEILGKEYYIYEVKKGESIYGIAKKYGWDLEELLRLNPEASTDLHKGVMLYYPTGQVSQVMEMPEPVEIDPASLEPIRHKVKKGETIYSISRQYGVPLETIYKYNPSTKKGVKTGEIVEMPQNGSSKYYYYTIKHDDTLSKIAQKYNTSVEDLLKDNAGLTVDKLREGEVIRVTLNSNAGKVKTELVAEERVSSISAYKVKKNESWDEISQKTGVEVEVLKEANEDSDKPKENNVVNVPVIETVEVEKTISYSEPEEMSIEQQQEIYDSIKGNSPDPILAEEVRMALILDEPAGKKDIDFTRGVLIALSDMKESPFKIDLKVLDGRVSTADLINDLDDYEPNMIVSTADKAFPLFLADYGNTNNIQIINAFDLKNDLFEDNASMIQLLPPSSFFYDRISTRIHRDNQRRKLLTVGDQDENDGMATELFKLFEDTSTLSLEDFGSLEPDILQPVLIYPYAVKKEEVADFFNNVDNLAENFPGFDFKIVGRSNWIAMTDDFGDKFEEYEVYVPVRVWLDEESQAWKSFENKYEEMFGGSPVRSIPNFAANGYDITQYFIPIVAENKGDFNYIAHPSENMLQTDFSLGRVNNWGGFINGIGYLVKFGKNGTEKIIVK